MKNYHLTKKDNQWKLTAEGNERASKVFETKKEGVQQSAEYLKNNQGGSLKIHLENGKIQEERTYPKSSDPKESKG
ncbi:DUF2188 domain-containing protein [Kaistella carnis]|uniref:DUF2188 domain-containing protein n=1 Tax=Kaistella carnis TaxID=1241979 RepID=UPI002896F20F|nr:DUF2188 domain-containing protein [Kaistella carnis]